MELISFPLYLTIYFTFLLQYSSPLSYNILHFYLTISFTFILQYSSPLSSNILHLYLTISFTFILQYSSSFSYNILHLSLTIAFTIILHYQILVCKISSNEGPGPPKIPSTVPFKFWLPILTFFYLGWVSSVFLFLVPVFLGPILALLVSFILNFTQVN